jgi:mercuric ion binding protein
MKKLMTLMLITFFTVSTQNVMAQKAKKTATIVVKTSTQCGMCKERVEKAMAYEKGVTSSSLDVKKAAFSITYKPTKTSPEKIREAISKLGYDADDVKANQKAYENLPACCQKGGMNH